MVEVFMLEQELVTVYIITVIVTSFPNIILIIFFLTINTTDLHFMQVAMVIISAMISAQGSVLKPAHVELATGLVPVKIVSDYT